MMVEEPCARSFPDSIFKSLMFLEYAGEVPEHEEICKSPAVKNALEEAAHRLQRQRAKLCCCRSLWSWRETYVLDESMPNYPDLCVVQAGQTLDGHEIR